MTELVLPWSQSLVRLRPPARRILSVLAAPREVVAWEEGEGLTVEGSLALQVFYADPAGRIVRLEREVALLGSWLARGDGRQAPPPVSGCGSSWWAEGEVAGVTAQLGCPAGRSLTVGGELHLHLLPPPGDGAGGGLRRLRVEEIAGEGEAEVLETAEVALDHRARQVIGLHASAESAAGQVVAGGVLAGGLVLVRVYCVGEDGVIRYHQVPVQVEQVVPVAAEGVSRARVSLRVAPPEAELLNDGGRLRLRVMARLRALALRAAEILVATGDPEGEGPRERVRVQEVAGRVAGRGILRAEHRLSVAAARLGPATGRAVEVGVVVRQGEVVLDGFWQWEVLYADEAGEERFARGEEPFSLSLSGAPPGDDLLAAVEEVSVRVEASPGEDGVLLRLLATVAAEVHLYRETVVELAVGQAPAGAGAATRTVDVERLVGQSSTRALLEKRGTLVTRAMAITAVASRVDELAWEVIPDQVLVRGVLRQQILYVDRHGVHRYQTESFPVSLLLDVPGAGPGQEAAVTVGVCHVSPSLLPDERTFRQQVVLDASCRVTERRRLTVVDGSALLRLASFRLGGSLPVSRRWRGSRVRGRAAVTEVAVAGGDRHLSLTGRLRLDLVAPEARSARSERLPFTAEVDMEPRLGSRLRVAVRSLTCRLAEGREVRVEWEAVAVAWWAS